MKAVYLVSAFLLLLGTIPVGGSCVTLQNDKLGNCLESSCEFFCARMGVSIISEQLNPGFVAEERSSRLYIVKLTRGSFAERAGLRPLDEIVSVDGAPVPFVGDSDIWQSGSTHVLRIRRGDQTLLIPIKAVPVRELLANLRTLSNRLELTSISSPHRSLEPSPYLSGLVVRPVGPDYKVERVLVNSPAYELGIMPGDYVRPETSLGDSTLEHSDFRAKIVIIVVRGDRERKVELKFASLSDLLAN
jgi:hypothetical protein